MPHLKGFSDWCIMFCAINVKNIDDIKDNMDFIDQSVRVMAPLRPSRNLIRRYVSWYNSYNNYKIIIISTSIQCHPPTQLSICIFTSILNF